MYREQLEGSTLTHRNSKQWRVRSEYCTSTWSKTTWRCLRCNLCCCCWFCCCLLESSERCYLDHCTDAPALGGLILPCNYLSSFLLSLSLSLLLRLRPSSSSCPWLFLLLSLSIVLHLALTSFFFKTLFLDKPLFLCFGSFFSFFVDAFQVLSVCSPTRTDKLSLTARWAHRTSGGNINTACVYTVRFLFFPSGKKGTWLETRRRHLDPSP